MIWLWYGASCHSSMKGRTTFYLSCEGCRELVRKWKRGRYVYVGRRDLWLRQSPAWHHVSYPSKTHACHQSHAARSHAVQGGPKWLFLSFCLTHHFDLPLSRHVSWTGGICVCYVVGHHNPIPQGKRYLNHVMRRVLVFFHQRCVIIDWKLEKKISFLSAFPPFWCSGCCVG